MKKITTLTLLSFVAISAAAQLSFTEIQIMPGSGSSNPGRMTAINGTMYFQASRNTEGYELWATDGTTAGTRLVKDIFPGVASSQPKYFTPCNGKTYFLADSITVNSLCITNGATAGTEIVKNSYTNDFVAIDNMCELNGKLIFTAKNTTEGFELWESDGTSAGTKILKDINPGKDHGYPGRFIPYNNKLYFNAFDGVSEELWCTDGTAVGTIKVSNMNYLGAVIMDLSVLNNNLYYTATNANGRSLYKSDGTPTGTIHLTSLNAITGYPQVYTKPAVIGNKLYFATAEGNYLEQLWVTDGTSAGTIKLMNNPYAGSVSEITGFDGNAYFIYEDTHQTYIYSTDGTVSGTGVASAFAKYATQNPFDYISNLTVYNGNLFFIARSINDGSLQLYAITPNKQVLNIKPTGSTIPATMQSSIQSLCVLNNKLLVSASFNQNQDFELWAIEGTPTGISNNSAKTVQSFTLYPNPANNMLHFTTANTYKQAHIYIANKLGQTILAEDITGKNTISLQDIAPGIYTVTIDADGTRETQQLTIQ